MIDYDKTDDDSIVAEVRRVREEIAADFGYDLRTICEAMRQRQALPAAGRRYAVPPPVHPLTPGTTHPDKKVG